MMTFNFFRVVVLCIALMGVLSKAQHVTGENSNASIPLDPFLDDEEFEKDYPFIVSFKFHLREEMLPQLFTEIAMKNMPCAFQDCNISLIDIAEATQISRFTPEVLAEAVDKLHINPTNIYAIPSIYKITPELIEAFLQTFGLTFSDIYKKFLDSLPNPGQTIPDVLNTLNVSVLDFMNAVAYGNDTVRLKVLSTGDYSRENVNTVLNITNKNATDMLKLIPLNVVSKQLRKVNSNEFTMFVENLGVTTANLITFYQYLNITPINFLSYPSFINIVSDYYDLLNPEEVLGTIVSKNKIVTSNTAKVLATYQNQDTDIVRKYVNFHAELVENPLVQHFVKNLTLKNPEYQSENIGHVEIKNPIVTEFAEVSTDYNKTTLFNCSYITKLPFGGVYSVNINVSQIHFLSFALVVTKTNNTLYNLGSPLFCHDKLYGIATENGEKHIKFSTFMKKTPGTTTTSTSTAGQPPISENGTSDPNTGTVSAPAASATLSCSIFSTILALIISKLSL